MIKQITIRHPNITFWSGFLLLNCLLFLPIYWFFREDISFLPLNNVKMKEPSELLSLLFWHRLNLDIFRLNAELVLITLLWLLVPRVRSRTFLFLVTLFYIGQILYAVYEGFIRSYYLLDPVFYNDFFLFADGTRYVLQSMNLSSLIYVAAIVCIICFILLLFSLHRLLFLELQPQKLSLATRTGLIVMGVLVIIPIFTFREESGLPETAVSSFTAKISQNIQLSQLAKVEADRFNSQDLAPFYQFTEADLEQKPNIYIIFLESYGSVLYKRADFQVEYMKLIYQLDQQLAAHNWQTASIRSEAPTWGGGSWLSYTSAMAGLRLESHAQFLALFSRYYQEPFPHLFNYLRQQGYRSYWLSSNSDELSEIEWQRYQNFYGVDEWLQFSDMQYSGPLYGWGPAPPDHYAIHFAHEYMNQDETPHVFFYITQNSHYPWAPLPDPTQPWQTFNEMTDTPPPVGKRIPHHQLRRQYLTSIQYELSILTDFITNEASEDDIFVLVGDHQPARVARYTDGWDTPVHIISKNSDFVETFYEYGFVPGLSTHSITTMMQHEGFYSLFMRNFLQEYGLNAEQLPEYMPNGVPLDK